MAAKKEKDIERRLRERIESADGWCIKLFTYVFKGLPDRLVLMPHNRFFFVECKRVDESGKPTEPDRFQRYVHKKLQRMGIPVYVVYDNLTLDCFMQIISNDV